MAESDNRYCVQVTCQEKRFKGNVAETNGRRIGKGNLPGLRHQNEPDPGQRLTPLAVWPIDATHLFCRWAPAPPEWEATPTRAPGHHRDAPAAPDPGPFAGLRRGR